MRTLAQVGSLFITAASIACGPSLPEPGKGDLPQSTTTGDAFPGVKCSAVRPQTEPDLMGWDSGSRANLNSLRRQGVIAVRYDAKGCNVELEVLSNCIGKGTYAYEPYSARDTKLARNASELFAELPLGAARLSGRIKGGRALRTDYMLAGVASLPAGAMFARTSLSGADCARATHVISRVYLGGFGMFAGAVSAIEAQASLFGAGAGGSTEAQAERVALEGNPEACETAQKDGNENKLCAVPLRIGLLALEVLEPPASPPGPATAPSPAVTAPRPKDPPPVAKGGSDRDGDGITDAVDQCPDDPEDKDGFADADGCRDADNDGDGILDAQDKCPSQPENRNGFQDEDGCPEVGPVAEVLGTLSADQITDVVNRNRVSVGKQCWQQHLSKGGRSQARVTAEIVIAPSGAVQSVNVVGVEKDSVELGHCVAARVKTWKFPAASKSTSTSVPFVFSSQ